MGGEGGSQEGRDSLCEKVDVKTSGNKRYRMSLIYGVCA